MAGTPVGDKKCSIASILKIFGRPPLSTVIIAEWKTFAIYLDTPSSLTRRLKVNLQLDKDTLLDVVEELLLNWVLRQSKQANLGTLLKIVCQLNWNVMKDFLQEKIRELASNWNDLDKDSQDLLLISKIKFLGNEKTLISLKPLMAEDKFMSILSKYFDQRYFKNWDQLKVLTLDSINFPSRIKYYVERKIQLRRKINRRLFEEKCEDVFVFEGLEHHKLSMLSKLEVSDTSGNQTDAVTARFIHLECEDDFQPIVIASKFPVHRIKYDNHTFYWISTFGSLNHIKPFFTDEDEEITENDFIEINLSTFNKRPFAFCSSPGMGKSMLLENLAIRVKKLYPKRFVILFQLRNLISSLSSFNGELDSNSAMEMFTSVITVNEFGRQLLLAMMNETENRFEVFLDGFDEIPYDLHLAGEYFLNCILEHENIRVFITSRKYFQNELENTIGVISLNIAPFNENDQTRFLSEYWKTNIETTYHSKLPKLASIVLESLSMIDTEEDFAGIPLQCYMLAEVYLNDVKRSCSLPKSNYQLRNPTKSLFELYSKFMEFRFQHVGNVDMKLLRKRHWREALILLYPNNFEAELIRNKLMKEVEEALFLDENVFNVGLLEPGKNSYGPVFVHRTFAEYFIAELITETIFDEKSLYKSNCTKFLFEAVLALRPSTKGIQITDDIKNQIVKLVESSDMWKTKSREFNRILPLLFRNEHFPFTHVRGFKLKDVLDFWTFQNQENAVFEIFVAILYYINCIQLADDLQAAIVPYMFNGEFYNNTVCFFLNANLESKRNLMSISTHIENEIEKKCVSILLVCTNQGYKYLTELIFNLCNGTTETQQLVSMEHSACKDMFLAAAKNGDVELFELVCQIVKLSTDVPWYKLNFKNIKLNEIEFYSTPIHEAVKTGNYKLTEYLLKLYGDKVQTLEGLWQMCLKDSWNDSKIVISNKAKIILLLHARNLIDRITPLETRMPRLVAVDLFIKICQLFNYVPCNEDAMVIDEYKLVYPLNDSQMESIVDWLIDKNRLELLTHADYINDMYKSLLQSSLMINVISPTTLNKIYSYSRFDLSTILNMAIICKRNVDVTRVIVHLSGDVNMLDHDNRSMLHHAAAALELNVIKYLLSAGAFVNLKNKEQVTPLHMVFTGTGISPSFHSIHDCVKLLVNNGADINATDNYGQTPLSVARAHQLELNIETRTLKLLGWISECCLT